MKCNNCKEKQKEIDRLELLLVKKGVCPRCENLLLVARLENGRFDSAKCCQCSILWGQEDVWANNEQCAPPATIPARTIISLTLKDDVRA